MGRIEENPGEIRVLNRCAWRRRRDAAASLEK
jgi:hypothetical protein